MEIEYDRCLVDRWFSGRFSSIFNDGHNAEILFGHYADTTSHWPVTLHLYAWVTLNYDMVKARIFGCKKTEYL